jgi:GT2 family glycosyltransferase
MRPKPIIRLLGSVKLQTLYPNTILIIDGSTNNLTEDAVLEKNYTDLVYFKVDDANRGLTKQRNFGINKVNKDSEIVCFLDDDTVLEPNYFEEIIKAFNSDNAVVGVGGLAINENKWQKQDPNKNYSNSKYYCLEGFYREESLRNKVRNKLGLQSNEKPGIMPTFSNGRTYGYPFNEKNYPVDLLVGMSFSFKRIVFENIKFSTYFEGYGLYEDADYCLRALKYGQNIIATNAKLYHYHDPSGRPNQYKYGKMVIRNGWYVWRVKYPNPTFKAKFKWHATAFVLTIIRSTNIITTNKRKEALTETLGRVFGWLSLWFNSPKANKCVF